MRHSNIVLALLAAAALAACGGGGKAGDQSFKNKFSAQVTFGDSLADVGTYDVGPIAQAGGGKFTINGQVAGYPELNGLTWTEVLAKQFGLAAPCAAQTGLDGQGPYAVPVVNHAGCYGYAQGGARVTNPVGPGNKLTGDPMGALTVPVVTQVQNHLAASGGKFSGTEVVYFMAGGNDALMQIGQLQAGAEAAGKQAFSNTLVSRLASYADDPQAAAQNIASAMQTEQSNPNHTDQSVVTAAVSTAMQQPGATELGDANLRASIVAEATAAGQTAAHDYFTSHAPAAVQAMGQAGGELAAIVKNVVSKGANFVVVNNLPDVSVSPAARAKGAEAQSLAKLMSKTFNDTLKAGLGDDPKILYVDLFTLSADQAVNPGPYGLSNTTTPACGANAAGGSSLICNSTNLISGDVSRFMFADGVHPTPFEHSLIAKYVAQQMMVRGWL